MGSGTWSTDVYDAAATLPRGHRRERVRLQRRTPRATRHLEVHPRSTRTA